MRPFSSPSGHISQQASTKQTQLQLSQYFHPIRPLTIRPYLVSNSRSAKTLSQLLPDLHPFLPALEMSDPTQLPNLNIAPQWLINQPGEGADHQNNHLYNTEPVMHGHPSIQQQATASGSQVVVSGSQDVEMGDSKDELPSFLSKEYRDMEKCDVGFDFQTAEYVPNLHERSFQEILDIIDQGMIWDAPPPPNGQGIDSNLLNLDGQRMAIDNTPHNPEALEPGQIDPPYADENGRPYKPKAEGPTEFLYSGINSKNVSPHLRDEYVYDRDQAFKALKASKDDPNADTTFPRRCRDWRGFHRRLHQALTTFGEGVDVTYMATPQLLMQWDIHCQHSITDLDVEHLCAEILNQALRAQLGMDFAPFWSYTNEAQEIFDTFEQRWAWTIEKMKTNMRLVHQAMHAIWYLPKIETSEDCVVLSERTRLGAMRIPARAEPAANPNGGVNVKIENEHYN
ncbi:hypothetical protein B0T10DRAFT_456135 [Thelonectria olida]|uniref:Uncharacterized protein n=1 Tax=Thelonectria olida TaxID=1576542 RepID=A0A9P8WC59_9HYPO|nr:hypothetical protein B0T10DRAFT_456135 [Thelonectria olida]